MIGKIHYDSPKIVPLCFYLSLLSFAPTGLRYALQVIGADISILTSAASTLILVTLFATFNNKVLKEQGRTFIKVSEEEKKILLRLITLHIDNLNTFLSSVGDYHEAGKFKDILEQLKDYKGKLDFGYMTYNDLKKLNVLLDNPIKIKTNLP
jgi:hypothetical protein